MMLHYLTRRMPMKQSKTLLSLLLVFTLCICGCNLQKQTTQASDTETAAILSITNTANTSPLTAGTPVSAEFTISNNNAVTFMFYTTEKTDMTVQITNSQGNALYNQSFDHTDGNWTIAKTNGQVWNKIAIKLTQLIPDKYRLTLTFSNELFYAAGAFQEKPVSTNTPTAAPTLSESSLMLAKGMSYKLKLLNSTGKVTWSSSNRSVATVSKGKIKTKRIGTALIKAKTDGNKTLYCKLTVVKNVYTSSKKPLHSIPIDETSVNVYKVSYDKKGNIIIKARILNRHDYRVDYFKNFKIKLRTNTGKRIGTYTAKKATNVKAKSDNIKNCTFKIRKSKLKIKVADLRRIKTPTVTGTIIYNPSKI